MRRYLVIIEPPDFEGDNFSAYVPDLPGCAATGGTESEVIEQMMEAIEFHLEGMAADGEAIPEGTSRSVEVAVREPGVQRSAA
ncbi:MAG TPA: type II toxin-antitoxin system HicB family antitoxin [Rhodothermales bacterium]|nr:type II toxin-antitoxin system HicB family antitoxin [Rhodothermales bacterium]